ncbi:MAG: DNA cytosine methyltransferase [Pseudomonadota bacterium]
MIYGSVCSGIEAATVAWHPFGWRPAFFSEIDKFPRAVLQHHYPDVPLHGDFTTIKASTYESIELLVGGTPCQSFSVAGLRQGLDDDRGNLALEYLRLAQRLRPRWLVWENVPGVLSSSGGRDFGAFLGGLGELGYGFAYRVLDAQYFGVPQRRRRVFVVGCLGDWRRAAAVLFERESLSGNPAPSRETRQAIAQGAISRALAASSTASGYLDANVETFIPCVSNALTANDSHDPNDKTFVPVAFDTTQITDPENRSNPQPGDPCHPLAAQGHPPAVAFKPSHNTRCKDGAPSEIYPPLTADADKGDQDPVVQAAMAVRRLTPRECERLQGFPDDYTLIPYRNKPADQCPDGPRYKALGNSMAVPVMAWIGQRIQIVEELSICRAEDELVEIVVGIN